jgi:hypothetical protein
MLSRYIRDGELFRHNAAGALLYNSLPRPISQSMEGFAIASYMTTFTHLTACAWRLSIRAAVLNHLSRMAARLHLNTVSADGLAI